MCLSPFLRIDGHDQSLYLRGPRPTQAIAHRGERTSRREHIVNDENPSSAHSARHSLGDKKRSLEIRAPRRPAQLGLRRSSSTPRRRESSEPQPPTDGDSEVFGEWLPMADDTPSIPRHDRVPIEAYVPVVDRGRLDAPLGKKRNDPLLVVPLCSQNEAPESPLVPPVVPKG